jgi:transcriptional regulator with XRE-family HTH domain
MSRRSRITPGQAGLTTYGGTRRVAGLKREEVAMLTGVSTEYYARLERGNLRGVSDSVLDSLARALQLDEAERAHLFDLAKAAAPAPASAGARRGRAEVRPSIERVLAGMTGTPAEKDTYPGPGDGSGRAGGQRNSQVHPRHRLRNHPGDRVSVPAPGQAFLGLFALWLFE